MTILTEKEFELIIRIKKNRGLLMQEDSELDEEFDAVCDTAIALIDKNVIRSSTNKNETFVINRGHDESQYTVRAQLFFTEIAREAVKCENYHAYEKTHTKMLNLSFGKISTGVALIVSLLANFKKLFLARWDFM